MRLFTRSIWITQPREAVFDYFLDFDRASRWRQSVRTMRPLQPGPVRAGSIVRVTWEVAGDDHTLDLRVLACERPSRWQHAVDEVDVHTIVEYRFDPERDGTRVTMRFDVKPASPYGWLSLPLLWLHRGRMYRDQLPQLKQAVEAG
jgi:uncharacterized protein YndB with AHSA1/START domain